MTITRLLLRPFRLRVTCAIVLGITAGACSAALIASIAAALQGVGPRFVAAFAVVAGARVTTEFFAYVQLHFVANETIGELRICLARTILRAPLRTLEEVGSARLLGALTEDAQIIGNAARSIVAIATALGLIVGSLAYLVWLSPLLGIFVGACLALAAIVYRRVHARGMRMMQSAMGLRARVFGALSGSVRGIHELKLHRKRREAFTDTVRSSVRAFHAKLIDSFRLFAWAKSLNLTAFFAVIGAIVFAWPSLSPSASAAMPAYVLALLYLPAPFELVLEQLPQIAQASATAADLDTLGLSLRSKAEANVDETATAGPWKSIELRGVVHRFRSDDDRTFTLGPIDIRIEPGDVVYVIGGNGSGKTTLAKILVGLYTPEAGEIIADGHPVRASELAGYRERFGAIFSDFHVFDRPYGVESGSLDEDAREILGRLAIDERVQIRGGVYSTTNLSQGQRARLALVTVLLQDPPIYLFDEWAAHQDPELKAFYYKQLLPELKARGKTVVAITHDNQYFHLADRVVQLDEGKMVQRP